MSEVTCKIDEAEKVLDDLCACMRERTTSSELRLEYVSLHNQMKVALKQMRSIAETDNYIKEFKAVGL